MYLPGHFEERDPARLTAIVDAHPLAVVVAVDERGAPEISHLPCLRDEEAPGPLDRVLLHVARGNRLAELELNQNRSAEDREDARRGLAAGGEAERAVAALMS